MGKLYDKYRENIVKFSDFVNITIPVNLLTTDVSLKHDK